MAATFVVVLIAILGIAIYKFYPVAIITQVQRSFIHKFLGNHFFILFQAQLVFSAFLPFVGFTISYALSSFVVWTLKKVGKECGVEASQHLTIGVETAVQNGRMVNAITLALYKGGKSQLCVQLQKCYFRHAV